MTASNHPENQKPNGPHDLGQITFKTWKHNDLWYCEGKNQYGERWTLREDSEMEMKSRMIDAAVSLYSSPYETCIMLAYLTSPNKESREYAKKKVREWTALGRTIIEHATAIIAHEKAMEAQSHED